MRKFWSGAVLLVGVVCHNSYAGNTYTVDDDGVADFSSIQNAMDSSADGDTIVVSPGTYFEHVNFNNKNIILKSTDPYDPVVVSATVIHGGNDSGLPDYPQNPGSVVRFSGGEDSSCYLIGMTITNGWIGAQGGGGIYAPCQWAR